MNDTTNTTNTHKCAVMFSAMDTWEAHPPQLKITQVSLARERTFLAYLRMALSIIGVGAALTVMANAVWFVIASLMIAAVILTIGYRRHR